MKMITIFALVLMIPGCSRTLPPSTPPVNAWVAYLEQCTERVKLRSNAPLCSAFPEFPGNTGREEMLGAALGLAKEAGSALFPLAATALTAHEASK